MAISGSVAVGDQATAAQYNNLRVDVLHAASGHNHLGSASSGVPLKYTRQLMWFLPGTAASGTNRSAEVYWWGPTGSMVKWIFNTKTAHSGASLIADVNLGGTSLWATSPANRPSITTACLAASGSVFDTATITNGAKATIDIDQIGSGSAGYDLTLGIQIDCPFQAY